MATSNSTTEISANQWAVIDKYNLEVSENNGVFTVTDAAAKKHYQFKDASKGKYFHKTLDGALQQAVEARIMMETPMPPASTKSSGKSTVEKKAEKVKETKVKKDNRYLRATKIIIGNPAITAPELAKAANMSESTAGHCLDAWRGVTAVLVQNNAMSDEWHVKLGGTPRPAPVPEKPKADKPAVAKTPRKKAEPKAPAAPKAKTGVLESAAQHIDQLLAI